MKKGRGVELWRELKRLNAESPNPIQQKRMTTFCDPIYYGRKLKPSHFSEFVKYLKVDYEKRPVTLSQRISGQKKAGKHTQIRGIVGALGVETPELRKTANIISPVYETDTLTQRCYISQKRRSCVGFAADHIEFRYRTKTKENFDYQSQGLQDSVVTAMLIGNVIAELHLGTETAHTPIFIPHKEGAFSGHAQKANAGDSFRRINSYVGKGINKGGENASKRETLPFDLINRPDWDPECTMRLLTFVPNHELSHSQQTLRQAIIDSFDEYKTTVDRLWDRFLDIMSKEEPEFQQIKAFEERLASIVTSPEWLKEMKYGQKHLPGQKWKPENRQP